MKVLACTAVILASALLGCNAKRDKIVGGEEAIPHEFPWQVSLRRASDNFHFCGGSVLNEYTVVSAAHCTVIWDSADEVVVVAGEHNKVEFEGTEQTVDVAELIVHESYGSPKGFENDIALWILASPLNFTDAVGPVALPTSLQQSEGFCTVTGWGTLSAGGSTPDVLMKVDVPVVGDGTCSLEYPLSIAESMLCAGERGKDSCQGDSGGPLICYNADGSGYLGGIVSWGRGCGGIYSPGVYTEVSYFIDWIQENN
ncbi:trypsin-1 [Eurytemora carolleeae]|uniref:trypsin-1 n=1 Tax=Eurytemora carolleeae TaxID=1294199 RepID=UPI000C759A02|nr:trypsin-1 [Eurytemora carolleeae]|eukprot:XP_023325441.1 trypsin-1-like [Eurytemora affinis]